MIPFLKKFLFFCKFAASPRPYFMNRPQDMRTISAIAPFRMTSTLRCIAAFLFVIGSSGTLAQAQSSYTEGFAQRHSYYRHTLGDNAALTSLGISSGDEAGWIKITGSGTKVSGLAAGDYLHIITVGRTFQTMGLFTNGAAIGTRINRGNRFDNSVTTSQLQVVSLRDADGSDFTKAFTPTGKPGRWTGELNATQDNAPTPMRHFRIRAENASGGDNPGIIVKVPAGATHLFKSADVNSFSDLPTGGCNITLTKIDPANRPRFSLDSGDLVISEGTTADSSLNTYNLRINRDVQTIYRVRVKYTLSHITSDGADLEFPTQEGTLEFAENVGQQIIPIQIRRDNIHEGDETFRLNLSVDPYNNPNEAYVDSPTTGSKDYTITLRDDDAVPTLTFAPRGAGTGQPNITHDSTNEPASGTVTYPLRVQLSRPSKFITPVWYAHNPTDLALAGGGAAATNGSDFSYAPAPDNVILIPAGSTWGDIPVTVYPDNIYEGPEKVVFHLGAEAHRATYNLNGDNGRLSLTINDSTSAPNVTLSSVGPLSSAESVTTRTLRLTRDRPSSLATIVDIDYSGSSATRNQDYTAPDSVTIPANANSADFNIVINDDDIPEFNETIVATAKSPRTNNVVGSVQGGKITLTIEDNDGGTEDQTIAPDSGAGSSKPIANSSIRIDIPPLFGEGGTPVAMWKIVGEPSWRMPGTAAAELAPGFHEIEFRAFEGFSMPFRRIISVDPNHSLVLPNPPVYIRQNALNPESITVNLFPQEAVTNGAKWKLEGESVWRDSGTTATGIPIGVHKIIFKATSAGYQTPIPIHRRVTPGANNHQYDNNRFSAFYTSSSTTPSGIRRPEVLANAATDQLPYSLTGRISTSAGFATGTAVRKQVVLTAAHALFDDNTLSHATDIRWHHQAQKGHYQPAATDASDLTGELNTAGLRVHKSAIIPRGVIILSGYAERRSQDPYAGTGSSTPDSQNLDLAVAYFGKDVARGGRAGILHSTIPGHWLTASSQKTLVGYTHDDALEDNLGKMHASAPADIPFTRYHERVWHSFELLAGGGVSGGPLFIRPNTGDQPWRQAAIYLGGTDRGIFRELDQDAVDLIDAASRLAGDDNNTGGGITHTNIAYQGSNGYGILKVVIEPQKARDDGARWGLTEDPSRLSNAQHSLLIDSSSGTALLTVRFKNIEGFLPPATQIVTLAANSLTSVTFTYQPLPASDPLPAWRSLHFGTTENTGTAADSFDADGDGQNNLAEFAAGTDPKNSTDTFKVLSSGKTAQGVFTLTVPAKSGRSYQLERNNNLTGTWESIGLPVTASQDGIVELHDPTAPGSSSFYRAVVSTP